MHQMLIVSLNIGKDVAVALFASWLYDRIVKPKAEKRAYHLEYRREEVKISKLGIRRVVTKIKLDNADEQKTKGGK